MKFAKTAVVTINAIQSAKSAQLGAEMQVRLNDVNRSTDAPIGHTVVDAKQTRFVCRVVAAGSARRVRQTLDRAADAVCSIKLA